MGRQYYNLEPIKTAVLAENINNSVTTFDVVAGTGANFIDEPCIAIISPSRDLVDLRNYGEHIRLNKKGDGAGGGNQDAWEVTRGVLSDAKSHDAGELILGYWSPEHLFQIQESLDRIEKFLSRTVGRSIDGVVRYGGSAATGLKVTELDTPGMGVKVTAGLAIIDGLIYELTTNTNLVIGAAPSTGNSRIDIVQCRIHHGDVFIVEIKAGTPATSGTEVAPTADSDAMKIADVQVDDDTTTVLNTNVTDRRVFL